MRDLQRIKLFNSSTHASARPRPGFFFDGFYVLVYWPLPILGGFESFKWLRLGLLTFIDVYWLAKAQYFYSTNHWEDFNSYISVAHGSTLIFGNGNLFGVFRIPKQATVCQLTVRQRQASAGISPKDGK